MVNYKLFLAAKKLELHIFNSKSLPVCIATFQKKTTFSFLVNFAVRVQILKSFVTIINKRDSIKIYSLFFKIKQFYKRIVDQNILLQIHSC